LVAGYDDDDTVLNAAPAAMTVSTTAAAKARVARTTSGVTQQADDRFQPSAKFLAAKFNSRIDVKPSRRQAHGDEARVKDKADRATTELVLDPRTLLMLYKLLNKGALQEIHGCVSTGKEANVYWARAGPNLIGRVTHLTRAAAKAVADLALDDRESAVSAVLGDVNVDAGYELAVKIYKTSILVFKDRDRYVTGEFRFRTGYSKKNPRKMVRTWAEKEMRNLGRLHEAGIPCPRPLLLREHVLVMEFLGADGEAFPRLKDAAASLTDERVREVYAKLVRYMRTMYHRCHLVHADLSEYNVLYHRGTPFVIDVSQSVEHDHPNAFVFLRADCTNVTNFFLKRLKLSSVMTAQELFEFVVARPDVLGDCRPDDEEAALCRRIPPALRAKHDAEFAAARLADAEAARFNAAQVDRYLDDVQRRIASRPTEIPANDSAMTSLAGEPGDERQSLRTAAALLALEEHVFMQAHIPQRLDQVPHVERDTAALKQGAPLIYADITGLSAMKAKAEAPAEADDDDDDDDDQVSDSSSSGGDDEHSKVSDDRDANRARKRAVRDARRKKRAENKANGRTKKEKARVKKQIASNKKL
jgi:RIO kinase 1